MPGLAFGFATKQVIHVVLLAFFLGEVALGLGKHMVCLGGSLGFKENMCGLVGGTLAGARPCCSRFCRERFQFGAGVGEGP